MRRSICVLVDLSILEQLPPVAAERSRPGLSLMYGTRTGKLYVRHNQKLIIITKRSYWLRKLQSQLIDVPSAHIALKI